MDESAFKGSIGDSEIAGIGKITNKIFFFFVPHIRLISGAFKIRQRLDSTLRTVESEHCWYFLMTKIQFYIFELCYVLLFLKEELSYPFAICG